MIRTWNGGLFLQNCRLTAVGLFAISSAREKFDKRDCIVCG